VAALSHPNILAIHDFGKHDTTVYAVMELLEGESLRRRLGAGTVPVRKAIEYALQIAQGLAVAHEKGVVHRDLKPDNLFVTKGGRIKILDFGLARQVRAASEEDDTDSPTVSRHTDPGTVMGTVGYMSPEQVRGKPVDHRSDVFSFGAVFYEMLTGQRAFRGESAVETMSAILKEEPPDLSENVRMVSPGVERIVRHCLEKNPEERFQSARDLAFDLQALSADSGRSAVLASAPVAAPRGVGRRILAWAALVIAGALLGVGLTREWPGAWGSHEMAAVRYLTYSGHDTSPAASPDGRTIAFCSDRDGRPRIWLKQLADGSEAALTPGPDDFPRFSPDGSTILFVRAEGPRNSLYRVPALGGDARKLVDDATTGDWSPDGRRIVFLRPESSDVASGAATKVLVAAADGGGQTQIAQLKGEAKHPRWSPDGGTIAVSFGGIVAGPQPIMLIAADGKETRMLKPPPPWPVGYISAVAWSSSTQLLYSQAESVAGDIAGGTARLILQDTYSGAARALLWSPNNGLVLDFVAPGRVVFDARSPRENLQEVSLPRASSEVRTRWITHGNSTDRQPTYSPDGEWVVFASTRSGNFDLWKVSTRNGAVGRLTDDPADDFDPAFTPDGKRLLWSSNRTGHFEIWTAEADGSDARQLTHDGFDAENATSTPDGRWIVYTSGHPAKGGIWKVHPDGSAATLLRAGWDGLPEVSPDGQYALCSFGYGQRLGGLRVLRVADGTVVPFEIRVEMRKETTATMGRGRWMPGGRAVAFIGQDERGVNGVFVQDFVPGRDTASTRRPLAGFDPEAATESFGISPDGSRIVVAAWEQLFSIMTAEGLQGVRPPTRRGN